MPISREPPLVPGSERSTMAFIALKIVVTAPLPREITVTATRVNTGLLRSIRNAKRKSPRRAESMPSLLTEPVVIEREVRMARPASRRS